MASLYEALVASVNAARAEPIYKAATEQGRTELRIAADRLNDTCIKLSHLSGIVNPDMTSMDFATTLEVLDYQLTTARERSRIVRRAAKAIVARREREERGVFKP